MIPEEYVDKWLSAHEGPEAHKMRVQCPDDYAHFRNILVDLLNDYTQHILDLIENDAQNEEE